MSAPSKEHAKDSDPAIRAADPASSVWVAANAGSGKTYTLAARVTRLLLAGAPPEKILCLTYTKAAAAEMAGRLFDQLGVWAMLPPEDLRANIAQIGGTVKSDADLARARRLFAEALETPGGLKIQTIHAFCQHVLMRFPLEAGLPASFTVLDDRTGRDLMAEARRIVFERAGTHDPLVSAAIALLVTRTSEDTMARLLDSALGADRAAIAAFCRDNDAAQRAARIRQAHGAAATDTERSILAECIGRMELLREDWSAVAGWLNGGSKTDMERAGLIGEALHSTDLHARYDALYKALLTQSGEIRKKPATKALSDAAPDKFDFLLREAERLVAFEDRRKAVRAAELAEALVTLADQVARIYAAKKRARGALDYDDLIQRTLSLLQGDGAAWVLYKLDEGIDHILIDEAQDTSAPQWDIVQALSAEFFAGDGARDKVRTLFAVGDEKQSIFSFQGADPKQFAARRAFFEAQATAAGARFGNVALPVSRRSAPEVLAFVDETFADPTARDGLTADGGEVRHKAHRNDAKGRIEYWPVITPAQADAPDPWDLRPLDLSAEGSPLAQLADKIAREIEGWLKSGATLPGHTRPISPGDIMILLPRREPFASEIIRRLKDRNVPVAGADRLKLADQIAVMDLVALGRFALTPDDDLTLAALLRSPLVGISEEALYTLAHKRDGRLWPTLEARKNDADWQAVHAFLADIRRRADNEPPFEFYARTLNDKRDAMLARLGSEAADAIAEFLNLALAYERIAPPSLEGFLHWFARGGAEVKRDMDRGRGEVRVMTVHGAKGLEADIVFLPDTTTVPQARGDALLYADGVPLFSGSKEDAPKQVLEAKEARQEDMLRERRRLLYVALTRAREKLIVCGFENKRGTAEASWNRLTETAARRLCGEKDDILTWGADSSRGDAAAVSARADASAAPALPDWVHSPAPEEAPNPYLLRPSEVAGADEPPAKSPKDGTKAEAAKQRGTLAHALFAHLPDLASDSRAGAARRFLAARGMTEADAAELTADVLAVLSDPVFADAFAPGSRAEVALMAGLPELAPHARIHGRIDRLAISKDHVLVVDFKTNRRPPKSAEKVSVLYLTQMALYRHALTKIFPDRTVSCALIWTEGPVLMPLSSDLLDNQLRQIADRLQKTDAIHA